MVTNIWRYSHFLLAALSSIFIFIAAVTGVILAFEPIEEELSYIESQKSVPISTLLPKLKERYDEVLVLYTDDAGHCIASISDDKYDGDFIISTTTGEVLGEIPPKRPLYAWATNLHRSLFLKSTGRLIVGVASFLLLLITITGLILVIKRMGGVSRMFATVIKEQKEQYYHVVLGRVQFLPIVIITISGVFLSLYRFDVLKAAEPVIESNEIISSSRISISEFPIFQSVDTRSLDILEMPFSEDEEDYYILSTRRLKRSINQYNGDIVEVGKMGVFNSVLSWMTFLHTGRGSILWSIVLGLASISILYFMYSGFVMSINRFRYRIRNRYNYKEAEYILLYGSENGTTMHFVKQVQQALIQAKKSVFVDVLNNYRDYPSMKELVVFTATYGDGDPPSNADTFLSLIDQKPLPEYTRYSVLGFGSMAYKHYGQFAIDVAQALRSDVAEVRQDLQIINNQSFTDFKEWTRNWLDSVTLPSYEVKPISRKKLKERSFHVVDKMVHEDAYEYTFTLSLKPERLCSYKSGDLLAIYPKEDDIERLYSIGQTSDGDVLLSVKKHDKGICSTYLSHLGEGDIVKAALKRNPDFHLNSKRDAIMISNGTGIAPFLGMIAQKSKDKKTLYWGGRTHNGYSLYQDKILRALESGTLQDVHVVYSRESQNEYNYIQDLIDRDIEDIVKRLENKAVIMLCGSVAMQNAVFKVLEEGLLLIGSRKLDYFKSKGQIKTDCY